MKKTAEKGKKIVFGVLLVLACILMPQKMTNAAGNTVPTAVDNLTVSLRNKVNMAVTDNGYMRVAYDGSKVRVEYYDTQFNLQRKGSLDLELPIWGGFYAGQDAYYLAEAQNNTEQSDTKEVIRVIKYDKNWRRLGAASITGDPELFGGEVRYPFDYGCVEMAESGNNLYLVTGHEGYVDAGVGQGHQGYLMVQIDKTTLKGSIVDCNLGHSFAQYIKSDGAQLYVLEQSEGGRCTELSKYDTASMKKQSLSVLEYGGFRTDAWAIACYASVDDLAVSSSNVLSVGTSIDQSQYDNVTSDMPHNLYLTITPKNNFYRRCSNGQMAHRFYRRRCKFPRRKTYEDQRQSFYTLLGRNRKDTENHRQRSAFCFHTALCISGWKRRDCQPGVYGTGPDFRLSSDRKWFKNCLQCFQFEHRCLLFH